MTTAEQSQVTPQVEPAPSTPAEAVLENERYQQLAAIALRQTRRILRNREDAAEIAQETMAKVIQATSGTDIETMGAYVTTAARRNAIGFLRRVKVFEALPCADPLSFSTSRGDDITNPSFAFENNTAFTRVGRAIALLEQQFSKTGAEILRLTAQDVSIQEIGEKLGMKPNAVSAQLSRSRKKLREYLEGDEV